jgi:hypothetical protein
VFGKLETLDLERIERDASLYRMSYYADLERLRSSLRENGLVNPPVVQETVPGRYRAVCGFRRLVCLEELGHRRCPAFVVPADIPERALFDAALRENASTRSFNPVEKAFIIRTLKKRFEVERRELLGTYPPLLSRDENSGSVLRWEKIADYPGFVQEAFADGTLCFASVALLDAGDRADREAFVETVRRLRLGAGRQKEAALLLGDLVRIRGVRLRTLLTGGDARRILDSAGESRGNAARRFLEWLRALRYPEYHAHRKSFEQWSGALGLPENVRVEPPPFFEDDHCLCRFTFRNEREFDRALEALERIRRNGKIGELKRHFE